MFMHNMSRKIVLILIALNILILFGAFSFMGVMPGKDLGGGLMVYHLMAISLIIVLVMIWKNKMS